MTHSPVKVPLSTETVEGVRRLKIGDKITHPSLTVDFFFSLLVLPVGEIKMNIKISGYATDLFVIKMVTASSGPPIFTLPT